MSEKKLYEQKLRARLDEWRADLDKLKAQAKGASANAQIDMRKQIDSLEAQVERARGQLNELGRASDEAWTSLRAGLEASWDSLKRGFKDAAEKFKKQ